MKLVHLPDYAVKLPRVHGFSDDFNHITAADLWTKVVDGGGTALGSDAAGGVVVLTGDGDDNDATIIKTTHQLFTIVAGKPLTFIARVKYTEAATNVADIFFGLSDDAVADTFISDSGVLDTSFDGVGFYKLEGSGNVNWNVVTSNATTQTTTKTDVVATTDTNYNTFRIDVNPVNSTDFEVVFFIDDLGGNDFAQCRESGANPRTPAIKHTGLISGLQEMNVMFGIKNGSGAAEIMYIDYVSCFQTR